MKSVFCTLICMFGSCKVCFCKLNSFREIPSTFLGFFGQFSGSGSPLPELQRAHWTGEGTGCSSVGWRGLVSGACDVGKLLDQLLETWQLCRFDPQQYQLAFILEGPHGGHALPSGVSTCSKEQQHFRAAEREGVLPGHIQLPD